MDIGVYALSGDPTTNGHLDVEKRIAENEGALIVAIGNNADKKYMFSMNERVAMAKKAIKAQLDIDTQEKIEVVGFTGLLTDFVFRNSLSKIYRGVRNKTDKDFELLLHKINETQEEGIVTETLKSSEKLQHVSSSAVKAILKDYGQIHTYVPLHIKQALEARMLDQYPISITGSIGTGKSYIAEKLVEVGKQSGIMAHNIDMDAIGHKILTEYSDQCYVDTRAKLIEEFGDITDTDGNILRGKLGAIAFKTEENTKKLNDIMTKPLKFAVRDSIKGKKGIILYNGALIPDWNYQVHSNNNLILLDTDLETQYDRIMARPNSNTHDTEKKLTRQKNTIDKITAIENHREQYNHGTTIHLDNTKANSEDIQKTFEQALEVIDIYGELRIGRTLKFLGINVPVKEFLSQFKNKDIYDNDARAYHNWQHIINCLNVLGRVKHLIPDEKKYHLMVLAFLGHDAVYASNSTTSTAWEEESAILMVGLLKKHGLGDEDIAFIYQLILDTKHRGKPSTDMGKLFADIDMSILATRRPEYLTYTKAIRNEYSHYTDKEFNAGRKDILQKFLKQKIFYSSYFNSTYENTARENIEKEIDLLGKK